MIDSKTHRERRKDKRYIARYGSFYVQSPHWSIDGEILDISRSGLSFCYAGEGPLNDTSVSARLFDNNSFQLDDIKLQTVSDFRIANSSMRMRRRGIQFRDVSPAQVKQIEEFIRDNNLRETLLP